VQSLGYDLFTHPRTIGIRGIYEIDTQFDSPPQDPDGLGTVSGLTPNSISGNPHCAESQARDTEIIPDQAFAGFSGGSPPWPSCGFVVLHIHPPFLIDAADSRCELLLSGGSTLPAHAVAGNGSGSALSAAARLERRLLPGFGALLDQLRPLPSSERAWLRGCRQLRIQFTPL
jgi:hypothetical protein